MEKTGNKYHRLVRIYYQVRASAYCALFFIIGLHVWEHGYGVTAWVLLVAQFLVYPHLIFWRACSARNSLEAEMLNLRLDSVLVGIWAAALEFPIWIAFTLFVGTTLNNAINRGARGAILAMLAYACGALAWGFAAGFRFSPDTSVAVTAMCLVGVSAYVVGLGNIVFAQYRKLRDAREALREGAKALAIQANAFENMTEATMIVSGNGLILSVNRAFTKVTGYSADDVVGKPESEFRLALQPAEYYDEMRDALAHRGYWSGTSWCRRKDSNLYREWRSISTIRDSAGSISHYINLFMDVSDPLHSVPGSTHRTAANAS
ncbi:MAG: PAS domain S-box protein [Betaproteobacteria bacterium]|nr:PAS domain S-box protein [Betaproteobacteria bacterium]